MADPVHSDPVYNNEEAARARLEAVRWPNGPWCPRCGSFNVLRMEGEAHRAGLLNCRDCRKQFSVTVGTVFERSHIPLHKWLYANHLMTASKKGISAHQLHRVLGLPYKTAWFMAMRLRDAMRTTSTTPMGGPGLIVEADETYYGKKETPVPSEKRKGRPYLKRKLSEQKSPIVALVERRGEARAVHMPHVTAEKVRDFLVRQVDRKSHLHTDESRLYPELGKEFALHETVRHSAGEYVRGFDIHTNSAEGFFGLFKRGMAGVYHHCGEQHLQRYLDEFSFRYSNRSKRGIEDAERAELALRGAEGKRLTYRRIDQTKDA